MAFTSSAGILVGIVTFFLLTQYITSRLRSWVLVAPAKVAANDLINRALLGKFYFLYILMPHIKGNRYQHKYYAHFTCFFNSVGVIAG